MDSDEVARKIISYLYEHVTLKSTLEGIIEWWLLEIDIKYQSKIVKKAIDSLVEKEFIKEILLGGNIHYQINQNMEEKILEFIKNRSNGG